MQKTKLGVPLRDRVVDPGEGEGPHGVEGGPELRQHVEERVDDRVAEVVLRHAQVGCHLHTDIDRTLLADPIVQESKMSE